MNILVVEDQVLAANGIALLVKEIYPDAEVNIAMLIADVKMLLDASSYDLIISDLDFNGKKDYGALELAYKYKIASIVYSAHYNEAYIQKALELGVRAFVCKLGAIENLQHAVRNYSELNHSLCQYILGKRELKAAPAVIEPILNGTEIRILNLLLEGKSRDQIAAASGIKKSTLLTYIKRMNEKNDCSLMELTQRYVLWLKAQ